MANERQHSSTMRPRPVPRASHSAARAEVRRRRGAQLEGELPPRAPERTVVLRARFGRDPSEYRLTRGEPHDRRA